MIAAGLQYDSDRVVMYVASILASPRLGAVTGGGSTGEGPWEPKALPPAAGRMTPGSREHRNHSSKRGSAISS
jgi:hypothetical protein